VCACGVWFVCVCAVCVCVCVCAVSCNYHKKGLVIKSSTFSQRNISIWTWTYNLADNLCWEAVDGIEVYLRLDPWGMLTETLTEVRGRLSVNKRTAQKFDMERFSIKNGNKMEGKEKYGLKSKSKFAALHNWQGRRYINSDWEYIRRNFKISAKDC